MKRFRKELTPPFVPTFDNYSLDDAHYFDREFTKRAPRDSPAVAASANAQSVFRGFSYSKEIVIIFTIFRFLRLFYMKTLYGIDYTKL